MPELITPVIPKAWLLGGTASGVALRAADAAGSMDPQLQSPETEDEGNACLGREYDLRTSEACLK